MIEIISDITTLWISVVMTVLLVTAATKANILLIEWKLRSSWKKQFINVSEQEPASPILIHLCSMIYKPKIPSICDHSNQDDGDTAPIVFC